MGLNGADKESRFSLNRSFILGKAPRQVLVLCYWLLPFCCVVGFCLRGVLGSCLSGVLLAFAPLLCCELLPWWCCGHLELSRAVKVSPCLPSRSTPCSTFSRSTTINRETGYSNVLMSPQQIYSMSPQATPASSASLPNCHTHPECHKFKI